MFQTFWEPLSPLFGRKTFGSTVWLEERILDLTCQLLPLSLISTDLEIRKGKHLALSIQSIMDSSKDNTHQYRHYMQKRLLTKLKKHNLIVSFVRLLCLLNSHILETLSPVFVAQAFSVVWAVINPSSWHQHDMKSSGFISQTWQSFSRARRLHSTVFTGWVVVVLPTASSSSLTCKIGWVPFYSNKGQGGCHNSW